MAALREHLQDISRRKVERSSQLSVKNNLIDSLKKEADHVRERNRITSEQFVTRNKEEIAIIEEQIKAIDAKLSVHQQAFFGFLQEHYPDWYTTIGKVCNEDILFNKELNPKLIKKSLDTLYGIELDLSNVKVFSKSLEDYEQERSGHLEKIALLNQSFLDFREQQAHEEQGKMASIGKKTAHLKNEIAQFEYEAGQDEHNEKKYSLDLSEWQSKGEAQREKDLLDVYAVQEELKKNRQPLPQP